MKTFHFCPITLIRAMGALLLVALLTIGCGKDNETRSAQQKTAAETKTSDEGHTEPRATMSQKFQELEQIRKKYEGKIIVANLGGEDPATPAIAQQLVRCADAMAELLAEWSPVGHTVEEVQFVIGGPGVTREDRLIYSFPTGYGGRAWAFNLKDGRVVGVQIIPIS